MFIFRWFGAEVYSSHKIFFSDICSKQIRSIATINVFLISFTWSKNCFEFAFRNHLFESELIYSLQAALQELEELKQIVPKESLVYFLIGKVLLQLSCILVCIIKYIY